MLFDFTAGTTPVLVNVPHAGTSVPPSIAERLSPAGAALPDTDWHVHRLVERAPALGAGLMRARASRYVIDLNRGRDDRPLYSGATTGLLPTETFDGEPVYSGSAPDEREQAERIDTYWQPYHDHLRTTLEGLRERHGHAVLFDVHSIRSTVPRLFEGRLPDLNLGTYDGRSCAPALQDDIAQVLAQASGFSAVVNGRFKGGHITRHYGRPEQGVHALQIEIAQTCYMNEDDPRDFDPDRAAGLIAVLEQLIGQLTAWRP